VQQRRCDVDIGPLKFDYAGRLDHHRADNDIVDGAAEYIGRLH